MDKNKKLGRTTLANEKSFGNPNLMHITKKKRS